MIIRKKGRSSQRDTRKPSGPPANEDIKFESMQLILNTGENIGVVSRTQALDSAAESGLDLVLIAESGAEGVPVAKIMDYGKELYNRKKKQNEAKKNQKIVSIKEVKFRPKIGQHDFDTKMNQAVRFLEGGDKLKVTLMFRGREMANKYERGMELFNKIGQAFEEREMLERLVEEKEAKAGSAWSKVFSIKKKT
jgi:translation initiation factor IF-3